MNKKILKLAVAAITCVALTGTTLAAPGPKGGKARHAAPVHHVAHIHHPAPPPRPCPPPPPRPVVVHHVEHHEANGWAVLGAAVIGGIISALAN